MDGTSEKLIKMVRMKLGLKEWKHCDMQKRALKVYQERGIRARKGYFGSGFDVVQ